MVAKDDVHVASGLSQQEREGHIGLIVLSSLPIGLLLSLIPALFMGILGFAHLILRPSTAHLAIAV